ncbi:thiol:disulfide interchange protein DsbA/DsbL [Oceanicoccus sagamiensis]|uniref:Thiol:disulfide interchange protein n=1 Tax=Oceanicoccus sagamiensis TaxID=716816 RepID=A0A1X9NFP7_9GAMM|nr:thiol:disulfide interchange protein DsbA/DsbL [Oceanicoccus sagamiensis]ARN75864.1 hypothetical protein BST96_18200 [Oceanicoccus sagamiensis]
MASIFRYLTLFILLPTLLACEQKSESFIEVNGKTYFANSEFVVLDTPIKFSEGPSPNFIEIFWYGCPHCERFEPIFQDWQKTLPSGLLVGRSPAIWSEVMVVHAYAYHIAQELQLGHDFHMQLFTRILSLRVSKDVDFHKTRIASLFAEQGIDRQQFDTLYASELIARKVAFSGSLMKKASINSTPSFLINGKYLLTGSQFGSSQELLAVARHLLEKELQNQPSDWW